MSNRYDAPWTEEQVATLRRLCSEGMGPSQIAKKMARMRPGMTRNAVIGKRDRLGIKSDHTNTGGMSLRTKLANAKASAKRKATPSAKPKPLLPESAPPQALPPELTWAPLVGTTPKPLIECRPGECRWPINGARGETLFCCAPRRGDGPYCAAHHRMAYVPVKRRAA